MFEHFGNLVASFVNVVKSGKVTDLLRALPLKPNRITVAGGLKFNVETDVGVFSVGETVNGAIESDGALSIAPSLPAIFYQGRPIALSDVTGIGLQLFRAAAGAIQPAVSIVPPPAPPPPPPAPPVRPVREPARDASVVRSSPRPPAGPDDNVAWGEQGPATAPDAPVVEPVAEGMTIPRPVREPARDASVVRVAAIPAELPAVPVAEDPDSVAALVESAQEEAPPEEPKPRASRARKPVGKGRRI